MKMMAMSCQSVVAADGVVVLQLDESGNDDDGIVMSVSCGSWWSSCTTIR